MLIDSHAHLDSDRYDGELDSLLTFAHRAGVSAILSIGIGEGPSTMHRALEIAHQYSGRPETPVIYASAGIHPDAAGQIFDPASGQADTAALDKLAALAADPKCIAIGEIGLDYYHAGNPPIETQHAAFIRQMEIAISARLPILIHCRPSDGATPEALAKFGSADAWDDTLTLIERHFAPSNLGGILHCFGGSICQAERALDCGFLISFAGNITFPRAQSIRDVAAHIPADRLLVETDCPFLAPVPHRGQRNEPSLVRHTAERLAELRGVDFDTLALCTTENFHRFFGVLPATAAN